MVVKEHGGGPLVSTDITTGLLRIEQDGHKAVRCYICKLCSISITSESCFIRFVVYLACALLVLSHMNRWQFTRDVLPRTIACHLALFGAAQKMLTQFNKGKDYFGVSCLQWILTYQCVMIKVYIVALGPGRDTSSLTTTSWERRFCFSFMLIRTGFMKY